MIRNLLPLLAILFFAPLRLPGAAYNPLGGTVHSQVRLSAEMGPYRLSGKLEIGNGGSLEIGPGVVIHADEGSAMLNRGVLRCLGTSEAPIIIRGPGKAGDGFWSGIFNDSLSESEFRFLEIAGARTAIRFHETHGDIGHAKILLCDTGVAVSGKSVLEGNSRVSLLIEDCLLQGNAVGIASADSVTILVKHSMLLDNSREGVRLRGFPRATLIGNLLRGNGTALQGSDYPVLIAVKNTFAYNGVSVDLGGYVLGFLHNNIFANDSDSHIEFHSSLRSEISHNLAFGTPVPDRIQGKRPAGLWAPVRVNVNGDSCDAHGNLLLDPQFLDLGAAAGLGLNSPAVRAGDTAVAIPEVGFSIPVGGRVVRLHVPPDTIVPENPHLGAEYLEEPFATPAVSLGPAEGRRPEQAGRTGAGHLMQSGGAGGREVYDLLGRRLKTVRHSASGIRVPRNP